MIKKSLKILFASWLFGASMLWAAPEMVKPVTDMSDLAPLNITGKAELVSEGPKGEKVLLVGGEKFKGKIDLKAKGIDSKEYDLIKVQVKADRGAVLSFAIENHPNPGDVSYWWVLDTMRGAFDWKTIWIDLRMVEELKVSGDSKTKHRAGVQGGVDVQSLLFDGSVKELERKLQGLDRRMWLGPIRFVKKVIDIDWDQSKAPYTWEKGQDLVCTYPLTITNLLDKPVTAKVELVPFEVKDSKGTLSENVVALGPKETKVIQAKISLPADIAAKKDPLYCEQFEVRARAEGYEDSEVTILRSSDPIQLTVTVPLSEDKLQFPLFPRPKTLPRNMLFFDEAVARQYAEIKPVDQLIQNAMKNGIYQYDESLKKADDPGVFVQALNSAAYLYDMTGEEKYLNIASKLLGALPDIWKKGCDEWEKQPVKVVGAGIITYWRDAFHYLISVGWRFAGTQRPPYQYSMNASAKGGAASSMLYSFDMVADKLDEKTRKRFIEEFLVPAGIHCRNNLIGDGNQQATVESTSLYAGLASRNWPLVSFAYSSDHGLQSVFDWSFDDKGIHHRAGYQTYAILSTLWMSELLYARGINVYQMNKERLHLMMEQPKGEKHEFEHMYFWKFIQENRLK